MAWPTDSRAGAAPADAGVLLLLSPRWWAVRRRFARRGSLARGLVLGVVGLLFWAVVFTLIYRIVDYFRSTPGVGDVLALKLLGMVMLAFLPILLLSNVITALSSFFLARDLELLAAAPVDGVRLYGARLLETMLHSSWMIVLVLIPILGAYAVVFDAGPAFFIVAPAAVLGFLIVPAVAGTALAQMLVNVFPARRARDLLALVALVAAAGLIVAFRLLRPEQFAKPEGFRDLVDFIAALKAPHSVWLPSEWAAEAILMPLGVTDGPADLFPLLLLTSTAAAVVVAGAWVHQRLFRTGLSRAQEGAGFAATRGRWRMEPLLAPLAPTARSLIVKDVRTFFRDTTQWSQLVLLAVLVIVYVYNIKVLPLFSGEDVGFFLTNIVVFLNIGLAGFVIAAIAARFVFPAVSLEGRTLWLLRSSPLRLASLIWTKYWLGLAPLLVLAVAITTGTNAILHVSGFVGVLSIATVVVVTIAIAALALGFGALFPRFNTENAADIPTGFGGLLFMMTAIAYLAIVVLLEAWPVYAVLLARLHGTPLGAGEWRTLALGLGTALALSVAATIVPLRVAARRLETLDE
jgi:ABC-2 type transport system permease protein